MPESATEWATVVIGLLTTLGAGGLLKTWIDTLSAARSAKIAAAIENQKDLRENAQQITTFKLDENQKFRSELFARLEKATDRNDELSQRYGVLLAEKAALFGENEVLRQQVSAMQAQIATEGMRANDAIYRLDAAHKRVDEERAKREAAEDRERELEKQLAIALRGRATRASDQEPSATGTPANGTPVVVVGHEHQREPDHLANGDPQAPLPATSGQDRQDPPSGV
jgi:leucyl aminopeptidase